MKWVNFDAGDYHVRNYPHVPQSENGLTPRTGGKFSPRLYDSTESFSRMLSATEYREIYGPGSDIGSVIDSVPARGSGYRRDYSQRESARSDQGSQEFGGFVFQL